MRLFERIESLEDERDGLTWRQRTSNAEERLEIGPREEVHHHVGHAVRELPDVVNPRRVRAPEAYRGARFPVEALQMLWVDACLWQEELDRDTCLQHDMLRGHHEPHAALAEDPLDDVLSIEHVARR